MMKTDNLVGIFIFVGVNTIEKKLPHAKGTIEFNHFEVFGMYMFDLCKHLGIDSSTDPEGMSVLLIFCKLPTFKC